MVPHGDERRADPPPLRRVWDPGCNTGTFARIAAEHADYVVAMDADGMAIEGLYRSQKETADGGSILPLVVNLSIARSVRVGAVENARACRIAASRTWCSALR